MRIEIRFFNSMRRHSGGKLTHLLELHDHPTILDVIAVPAPRVDGSWFRGRRREDSDAILVAPVSWEGAMWWQRSQAENRHEHHRG